MSVFSTLPAGPLTHADREEIRACDGVEALITIGTTSIRDRRGERTREATHVVVLFEGTVYALEYEEFGWSREILQYDADRHDQLERALDRLDQH